MSGRISAVVRFRDGQLLSVRWFMAILLILASQAPQAGVVAYEKLTGKVKWTTPSLGPVGYVSPAIVKVGGEDHVVMITASAGRGESAKRW